MKICLTPGCTTRLFGKGKYCAACAKVRKQEATKQSKLANKVAQTYTCITPGCNNPREATMRLCPACRELMATDSKMQPGVHNNTSVSWYSRHPPMPERKRKKLDAEQWAHDKKLIERLSVYASPVRVLTREEIAEIAHTITPVEQIKYDRHFVNHINITF